MELNVIKDALDILRSKCLIEKVDPVNERTMFTVEGNKFTKERSNNAWFSIALNNEEVLWVPTGRIPASNDNIYFWDFKHYNAITKEMFDNFCNYFKIDNLLNDCPEIDLDDIIL